MSVSDFRSDTVTRPTPEMRRALADAVVGDDVLGDDPTTIRLEAAVAELFGKEAGLFVPSGTMGNQIAASVHAPAGSEVLLEEASHCLNYERGGLAFLSRLQTRPITGVRGVMDPAAIRTRLRAGDAHSPGTGLVIVENTHNFAGGSIVPLDVLAEIRGVCRDHGVPLHIDGARLWHAAIATGIPLDRWAAEADSLMVCLSKGLGAPVGSVLLGTAGFIERARLLRKVFGGGMRQVGILAAAGFVAIEHGYERLVEDHVRARRLAEGLAALPGVVLDPSEVETNIVIAGLSRMGPEEFVGRMAERAVWLFPAGPDVVRLVTHRDLLDADVDRALCAAAAVLGADGGRIGVRLFEPFAHAGERTSDDHERMGLEGVTVVVEPVRRRAGPWGHPASFRDHVAGLVEHEPARLAAFGLRHLQALALPEGGAVSIEVAMACVEELRPWLARPSVVAIGTLGPGPGATEDEEIFKRQLDLAAEVELPAIVAIGPEDAAERCARTLAIAADMALDQEGLTLVSDDIASLEQAREAGLWLGLPVGPGARFEPVAVVDLLMRHGVERTLVGSTADGDASDPLAVAAVVREARRQDMSTEEIETLVWRNPATFYGRSGKLDDMR